MKIKQAKTPFSRIWQLRIFGRDWLFGYIKIHEVAEIAGYVDPNEILERDAKDKDSA